MKIGREGQNEKNETKMVWQYGSKVKFEVKGQRRIVENGLFQLFLLAKMANSK